MNQISPQEAAHLNTARALTLEMVKVASEIARECGYYGVNDHVMMGAVVNAMASVYLATVTQNTILPANNLTTATPTQ